MTMQFLRRAAALSVLAGAIAMPAYAESFASSASSAGSASSGSVSDSISGSSKSSSGDDKKVAAGQYRVMEVAEAPGKPGATRLTLRGEGNEFFLVLPKAALAERALAPGALVQVNERPYGYEFAYADNRQAFFLVLPKAALADRALAPGALVQVNERPYGYEFAYADNRQAFFLALHDAWQRELRSHAI